MRRFAHSATSLHIPEIKVTFANFSALDWSPMIRVSFALFALLAPLPAHAYLVKNTSMGASVHWGDRKINFTVNALGDAARDKALFDAAKLAAAPWGGTGEIQIEIARPSNKAKVGFVDNKTDNVIAWTDGEWEGNDDDLALTFLHYNAQTGEILDADIVMNDVDHAWSDALKDPVPATFDTANVLTHEMGHAIGLDHSTIAASTMYPSSAALETIKRDLADDDRQALASIYKGTATATAPEELAQANGKGGCQSTPIGAPGLALISVGLAWARVRRSNIR